MKSRGFNMTKEELNRIYKSGETHAVYNDTDSVIIDGRDKHRVCMTTRELY